MPFVFGGYHVTFSPGEEPLYLQLAWPTNAHPRFIQITRDQAKFDGRHTLAGLHLIAIERRERKGITYELELYGRPGAYLAEPMRQLNG